MSKTFTWEEVAQHKTKSDCFVVYEGKVLDVSSFLSEHPGGEEVVMDHAGKDITQAFEDIGHSENAKELMDKYVVGKVAGPAPSLKKANPSSTAKPIVGATKPASGGSSTTVLLLAIIVAVLAYYFYSNK